MPNPVNLQDFLSPQATNVLSSNGQKEKPDVVGEIEKIPGIDIMPTGIDKYVLPYLFDFILGVDNIASGTLDFLAGTGETLIGTSREQQLKNKKSRDLRKPFAIQAIKNIDELISNKYIDETGRQLDVADLYREEEWGYMAELGFQSAMNSAPSTIISVINPLAGGAILGASTTGGKYYEDLKNRPDETVNSIIFNSILAGGSEWGTEYLGGKYLSGLGDIGGKTTTKAVKEYTQGFVKSFFTKVIGGALSEAATETLNAVVQESGNVLFYEDEISQKKYIDHVINAAIPALMLGGKGGAVASFNPKAKENLYKLVAPKKWKQEFFTVSKKIHDVNLDISKANPNEKKGLQEELDNLIKQRDKKISDLNTSFENLTNKEFIEYAENLDKINKNLDKIGNNKFSETTQERAEQENLKLLQENFDLIGKEYTAEDIETEKIIGETLKASEIIEQRLGKLKGVNRDDLDIVIVKNDKDLDKLSDKNKDGVKNSDGAFIGKNEDGKATIYINQQVAALAGATNVVGHELLHYMISRKFKTDNKSMEPLIGELKDYLQKNHSKAYSKVQKRIDNFYTDKKTGKIKEGALEEYLNVFSDLIAKEKINISESGSKGFTKGLKDVMSGFGFGNIKLETAEDVISFLSTYEKNINRKGLLGKLMGTKILDIGLESSKLQKIDKTKKQDDTLKESKSQAVDAVNKMEKGAKTKDEFLAKEKVVGADGKTKVLPSPFDNIYNEIIKQNGAINNYVKGLGLSKEKFQETIEAVSDRLINYDPAAERKTDSGEPITVGEFLMANIGYGKLVAAKKLAIEADKEGKTTRIDAAKKTKEGETTFDIEDTDASTQEILDEQDMSVEGIAKREAKEAKAKKKRYSKLRQELGFETDGDTYKAVLDAARKSILLAYKKTLKITDPKARVDKIVDLIKKEYNSLNSDLFKPLKNFLGTKEYLKNLRKYGEAIVESISTADLVQMEKFTPDNERIFTTFVRKLTKKSDVQDAVNKNLLPKDALNTIDKGEAVNLYQKTMPTPNEIVGFANQPAINPVTGARSGLKGTRKDGFAKRIAESLILDAVMEVRQETEVQQTLTEDLNVEMDVQQLASKIGRDVDVKFSKSNAVNDVNNALDNIGDTRVYLQVRFSKSHREQYENRLTKKRTDLTEEQRKNAVQSVFDFVDGKNIPDNKKSKYEKMAMHYMVNGHLILPEDGYKVIEAERIATIKKLDAFSYKNPNVLIEDNVADVKAKKTNPDKVKTFSNKTEYSDGVVVYDVEDSKQGQRDVREVIDTHFGKKSNPWCLCARQDSSAPTIELDTYDTMREAENAIELMRNDPNSPYTRFFIQLDNTGDGAVGPQTYTVKAKQDVKSNLDQAWKQWKDYNTQGNGHRIAFHNGNLVSFRDGNAMRWWDRNDSPTDAVVVRGKKGKDGYRTVSLAYKNKTIPQYLEKVTGNKKNGTTIKKDLDGNTTSIVTKKNGKYHGTQFQVRDDKSSYHTSTTTEVYNDGTRESFKEEKVYKDYKGKSGGAAISFGKDEIIVNNITKDTRSLIEDSGGSVVSDTRIIEGTVNQQYSTEFPNPSKERYSYLQGEKVKVERVTDGDNVTVKINGEVQSERAKFSRSANNEVKFSLTKKQDKKISSYIKTQIDELNKKDRLTVGEKLIFDVLNVAGTLIDNGHRLVDVVDILNDRFPTDLVTKISELKVVKQIRDGINNITMPEIRRRGMVAALNYTKPLFESAKSVKAKMEIVDEFVKNIGRSNRTGELLSNKKFKEQVLYKEFGKDFIDENYELQEVGTKENPKKALAHKKTGGLVPMYQDITKIKNTARSNNDVSTIVNNEAAEATAYIFKIIDSDLTIEQKLSIVDLMSLDQRGPIRKMYKMGITLDGTNTDVTNTLKGKKVTLEHEITVTDMTLYLQDYIKGRLSLTKLNEIINQAKVHVLPVEYKGFKIDDILNEAKHKITGGSTRYKNPKVQGLLNLMRKDGLINTMPESLKPVDLSNLETVLKFSRSTNNPTKGITILDFDDTLATSSSLIRFTRPDGTKGTLTPEQYASTYEDLLGLDYKFDFSEFNKVVDGKPAPLLNKAKKLAGKFGTDNMFILTARPQESAVAIQKFLKENGLNIPLKNITGLGNSTADAKALWVLNKANEGYNDFYFADDAIQNVKAVKNMLGQIDVKSKVQQARVKFSKSMNEDFNNILEDVSGIESNKRFSEAKARRRGKSKGKFRYFIPPSHEDFVGLLYNFMGKGEKGNQHRNFFEQALVRPLNRAYRALNGAKQAIANDYRALIKGMPEVRKKLGKKILDGDYTHEDAIRVYLWDKAGFKIPGLSKTDQNKLSDFVKNDPALQSFADTLGTISKDKNGYVKPSDNWDTGGIKYDLIDATGRIGRAQFFQEFIENTDIIFSKENLNKIEAIYGKDFREALEDMLYRVNNGTNRPTGTNRIVNAWIDWINGSVGATMFFNARSAILQQLSFVNFMNFGDNNIFKAAAKFANQKQFWSDFAMIFNSDYLKQRRTGAGFDVNASEIAREVSGSKQPVRAAIRYLLNLGFLPTQMGDSFAIAIGGASFYRNRVETYIKQGMGLKEAEAKAFIDFQEIAEETQQSARPDMISQQQASVLGRFILAFQNVTSQYVRIIKKSGLDLINRRISKGYTSQAQSDTANVSRIIYYGAVQSMIFYGLQTALFAMMFDDDEQDEEFFDKKRDRMINGTIDSILKGTGVYGAIVATVKNTVIKFVENSKSDSWFKTPAWIELLQISPPIGIKIRKISGAERTIDWNTDVIKEMETFDIDNPLWDAVTSAIEGVTNVPLNRLHRKIQNLRAASDSENAWWQRIAVALGWSKWDVGVEDKEVQEVKKKLKKDKSKKKKTNEEQVKEKENEKKQNKERKEGKETTCIAVTSKGSRCSNTPEGKGKYCTIHVKVEQSKSGEKKQCKKTKSDGKRCKMQTSSKSGYCYYHD